MVVTTGIIVVVIVWLGSKIYKWAYDGYDLFEKLNVKFLKPAPFFGTNWKLLARKVTLHQFILDCYNAFPDASIVGLFDQKLPVFMIRDPELVKQVGVKDFDHFVGKYLRLTDKKGDKKCNFFNIIRSSLCYRWKTRAVIWHEFGQLERAEMARHASYTESHLHRQ